MPKIPAFCDNCGAAFESGFVVEDSDAIHFHGCSAGPCPHCGSMGHIPDGMFNFIGNTIVILSAPERTVSELTRLTEIIREAKKRNETTEEVVARVNRDLPGLSQLAELLPKNRAELYGFLAVVLAAAQLLIQSPLPKPAGPTITINQVVQQVCVQEHQTEKLNQPQERGTKKPARNAPCPCGSGKKYKKCCGGPK